MNRAPTLHVLAEHADRAHRAIALANDALAAMQTDITHGLTAARYVTDELAALSTEAFSRGGDRDARAALIVYLARMGAATDDELHEYRAELADANVVRAMSASTDRDPIVLAEQCEDDRDELSATVERLYDGITAAIAKLPTEGIEYAWREIWEARSILRNLSPEVTA